MHSVFEPKPITNQNQFKTIMEETRQKLIFGTGIFL